MKLKKIVIALLVLFLFNPSTVKAGYNGGSGGGSAPTGSGCPTGSADYNKLCPYNNAEHGTVRITIYHFNGNGTRDQLGQSVVYTNNDWRGKNFYRFNGNVCGAGTMNGKIGYNSTCLEKYFSNTANFEQMAKRAIGYSGTFNDYIMGLSGRYASNWNQKAPGAYGFRIVIEPYLSFWVKESSSTSSYWFYTPKEMATKTTTWDSKYVPAYSNLLSLSFSDVGVTARGGQTSSKSDLANRNLGYGYNFIDVPGVLASPKCDVAKEGVAACCKKVGISGSDKSRNTLTYLTRVLTNKEIDDYCEPRCNPDKLGVATCCSRYGITPTNTSGNTTTNLTRPLTWDEINKQCGNPNRCDPDTDGVGTCCTRLGIKRDDKSKNNLNFLMRPLTDHEINTICDPPCEYKIDAVIPTDCKISDYGYVRDIDKWNCIFASPNQSESEVKTHYNKSELENRYCAVYCREEIEFNLPAGGNKVMAGRYMTISSASEHGYLTEIAPVKFSSKKTCRITNGKAGANGVIDRQKFVNEFNKKEEEVKSSWDAYNKAKAYQAACDGATSHTSSEVHNGKTYKTTVYNGKASWYGGTESCSWTVCTEGHGSKPNAASATASALKTYENTIKERDNMINDINQCSSATSSLDFDPNLKFSYEEPIYGGTWDLKKYNETTNATQTYSVGGNSLTGGGSSSSSYGLINGTKYNCTGNAPCTKSTGFTYPNTDWWEKTYERSMHYELPENVYRYVSRDSNKSYHTAGEAGSNYKVIDRSNLPIHYSTNPGHYCFDTEITTLGSKNKFTPYINNKKKFNKKTVYGGETKYKCTYEVLCEVPAIISNCDAYKAACGGESVGKNCEEGMKIEYRTISLYEKQAFPGLEGLSKPEFDGEGRKRGLNWIDYDRVNDIIYNGRGEKSYDIYKLSPMYEVTLDVAKMRTIREYNKKMNGKRETVTTIKYNKVGSDFVPTVTTKTGIAGFSSFEGMSCTDGEKCISSKIRDWGVKGCAISKDFTTAEFPKCGTTTEKW